MINQNIRIRLKSFDHNILDKSSIDILQTAKRTGAKVIGTIPMPSKLHTTHTSDLLVFPTYKKVTICSPYGECIFQFLRLHLVSHYLMLTHQ